VNEDRTNTHCVDEGWKVEGGSQPPDYIKGNCGSSVKSTWVDNGCYKVAYHMQGCGTIPGINKCLGHGFVTYNYTLPISRIVETDFAAQGFEVPATTDRSFTFQYDRSGLPPESQLDSWKWTATLTASTGEVISLSNAAPVTSKAHGVLRDGVLSIQLDAAKMASMP
jgi:hypothetical protein